jgi:excisionase family DNA binding protein
MVERPWLTVQEAASYAAVSTDTIYSACERGELRHTKINGRRAIRIRVEWVDNWLEQHCSGTEVTGAGRMPTGTELAC